MKFEKFKERSLIMGLLLSSHAINQWLRKEMNEQSDLSYLNSLILVSLHFEDKRHAVGPSRLSHALGMSRSRISQELSKLEKSGYLKRTINSESARSISVTLTSLGEKKAVELIKIFTRLQRLIDSTLGETHAETTNHSLLKLVEAF